MTRDDDWLLSNKIVGKTRRLLGRSMSLSGCMMHRKLSGLGEADLILHGAPKVWWSDVMQ